MTICGTNEYMAPELLFDEEYGASVDIFSFGMVLFEIIGRKHAGHDNYCARKPQNRCYTYATLTSFHVPIASLWMLQKYKPRCRQMLLLL